LISYLAARSRSFAHALRGLAALLRTQPNAAIHLVATVVVLAAGAAFAISLLEWGLVVVALMSVWVAEAMNTAIESAIDLVSPDVHPLAQRAKDVAAGAVLLAATGAVFIGLVVFGPHILALMR
jgi:diacylglycerol kinase